MASPAQVGEALDKILSTADIETLTEKKIKMLLQEEFEESMEPHKGLIKKKVDEYLMDLVENSGKRKADEMEECNLDDSRPGLEPNKAPRHDDQTVRFQVELDPETFLMVRSFKGRAMIDLRRHYKDGQGVIKPGKGVTLTFTEFQTLCDSKSRLEEAYTKEDEDAVVDLGRMRLAKISTFKGTKIDIREHIEQEGVSHPTKKGCHLSLSGLEILVNSLAEVEEAWKATQSVDTHSSRPKESGKVIEEPDLLIELGPKTRITVSKWKSEMRVDFREVYEKDGQKLPGKKGISLPAEQFENIKAELANINAAFTGSNGEYNLQIGSRRYVRTGKYKGKDFVDIREYYQKGGKELPSQRGIRFDAEAWKILSTRLDSIADALAK